MKPDWDALGDEYADSKTVIIGDVDCTAAGKLCEKYGVRGCAPPPARPPRKNAAATLAAPAAAARRRRAPRPPTRRPPPLTSLLRPRLRRPHDQVLQPARRGGRGLQGRPLARRPEGCEERARPGHGRHDRELHAERKTELEKYGDVEEERATKLEKAKEELKTAEDAHNELLKQLQSTYGTRRTSSRS